MVFGEKFLLTNIICSVNCKILGLQRLQPAEIDAEQECIDEPVEIAGYEAVFEMVADESGEERVFVNTATLPASATAFTASPEFVVAAAAFRAAGDLLELKVEVIAIEASGNKAITEETLWPVDD